MTTPRLGMTASFVVVFSAACANDQLTTPALTPRVVVHAVLDAQLHEQVILVEQTQNGGIGPGAKLHPGDLVATAGGHPVSYATVVLHGPLDSVVAVEDRSLRSDGTGAGMYRIRTTTAADGSPTLAAPGVLRLVPGEEYRLVVKTSLATVTGSTRLPNVAPTVDRAARTFNVDRDTLWLAQAERRRGAPAYLLRRIHASFSRSDRFEQTIAAALLAPPPSRAASPASASGVSKVAPTWAFAASHDAIVPGTTQQFSVVAVDANYLRYATVGVDPFGDGVLGNSLRGGVGLFGAVSTLTDVALDLVADRDHALEGEWTATSAVAALPLQLRLYESPRFPRTPTHGAQTAPRPDVVLTGTARYANGKFMFVEAAQRGAAITLVLRSNSKSDPLEIRGELAGGALTLFAAGGGVKVPYRLQAP